MARPTTWICTVSKGRLGHLQKTMIPLMRQLAPINEDLGWALLDFECPEQSGRFCEEQLKSLLGTRLIIRRISGHPFFAKTIALNALEASLPSEAKRLLFVDADTKIASSFFSYIKSEWLEEEFLIAGPGTDGRDIRDLTGFLGVSRGHFQAVGGYDTQFSDYGAEDLDLRLRLHLELGLPFREVPRDYLDPLPHSDEIRARYLSEKNLHRSNLRNQVRLAHKVEQLSGRPLANQCPTVRRLWGHFETNDQFALNEPDVAFEASNDEALLIHFETGRYFHTNRTGASILRVLVSGTSLSTLLAELERVQPTLVDATRRFACELLKEKILRPSPNPPAPGVAASSIADRDLTDLTSPPELEVHEDLQDLLLLDPIHDAAPSGWPAVST